MPGGFCVGGSIPGCCNVDSDCADNDACTTDKCDPNTKTCSNQAIAGCCNVDGQCNDGDSCTKDSCSGPGGTCKFSPVANCCSPNDPKVGTDCDPPQSPYDQPPCKAGHWACMGGQFTCIGQVKPGLEVCDGIDNNCDGVVDVGSSCPNSEVCHDGVCVGPCKQGEFACPGGLTCSDGYCMPSDCKGVVCPSGEVCQSGSCVSLDGGGAATGAGGASAASTSSASGGFGFGGGGGATSGEGGASATSHSASGVGGGADAGDEANKVWGLATGGTCRCTVPGNREPSDATAALFAAVAAAVVAGKRRLSRRADAERGET
jgi:hypothetical protein